MGFFSRLKEGLNRTRINLVGAFSGAVIDDMFFYDLEDSLIAADVGYELTKRILQGLRDRVNLNGLKTRDQVKLALRDIIAEHLSPCEIPFPKTPAQPLVVMMTGVNGAGKTTTIGKISKWFAAQDKKVLLAAADTFRAAAREQLSVWGERNRIEVISQSGGDPAAVVFDAVKAGLARGADVIIADTAGRLPTQKHLMDELARIKRAGEKSLEGAPHEILLVVDGTTGQNALAQVEAFNASVGLTGLIVTKLDGTSKGGVLLALRDAHRDNPLPIYFIGVGERIDDLQPFSAKAFASALVGIDDETQE